MLVHFTPFTQILSILNLILFVSQARLIIRFQHWLSRAKNFKTRSYVNMFQKIVNNYQIIETYLPGYIVLNFHVVILWHDTIP
jgi:hypothetical protein